MTAFVIGDRVRIKSYGDGLGGEVHYEGRTGTIVDPRMPSLFLRVELDEDPTPGAAPLPCYPHELEKLDD